MESELRSLFTLFDDYLKLHSIKKQDDSILIFFDYITLDNIDPDLDLDEEYYHQVLYKIDNHFLIYSKEYLLVDPLKNIIFDSSYKKLIFKLEDKMFSQTLIDKNKLFV